MSSGTVYVSEPATHGKVVLHTSVGPLDVELWSKEAPLATRNFVQLGLEGYYDGCIFHRLIKGFMAQTGDPTRTGSGGESVYGKQFKDEFHSRLRFTHRGLLAMASTGPDTNASQFFLTLDRCEWLDRKHTIFGKVTGSSLYNLPRFDELEVDANDVPAYPPRIERFEVLLAPFDDICARATLPPPVDEAAEAKKKRPKPKKNVNLLSFGEEVDEEAPVKRKVTSSHDLLEDPHLSKQQATAAKLEKAPSEQRAGKRSMAQENMARAVKRALDADASGNGAAAAASEDNGHGSAGAEPESDSMRAPPEKTEAVQQQQPAPSGGSGWKWRGKGPSKDDDDDDDDDSDGEDVAVGKGLKGQMAAYAHKKRSSAGLTKAQRQQATLAKLNMFKARPSLNESEADDDARGATSD